MTITPATRLFALLGDPVAHSLSPAMQNAAFAAAGLDGVYFALRCDGEHAAALISALARAGGGGNVTVPHKRLAAEAIEHPSEEVVATGACNTFWLEKGRVCGDNTDVVGFAAAARSLTGSLHGLRGLVVGSGGAARAAVRALLADGAIAVIVARSRPALEELVTRFDPAGSRVTITTDRIALRDEPFDLVVNATPLGLRPDDPLPVDLTRLGHVGAVMDMVYHGGATAFTRHASACGIRAIDGGEMLVAQGAAAFERWWHAPAPIDVMRNAVRVGAADRQDART